MTKFDVGRDVNLDLLAAELDAALGEAFLGLSGGNGNPVVVHLDGHDLANVDRAREVVDQHKPKKLTAAQKQSVAVRQQADEALRALGVFPGSLSYQQFCDLPEDRKWLVVFYLWNRIAE